jgi:formyltetrahydrofolate-dependent phosphoribosylglycinamide formyltransferase
MTPRIIVFISGNGSNLQALIDANLPAEIALVVSNRKAAYGLQRAAAAGIPTLYAPLKPYTDAGRPRSHYDADLAAQIAPYAPDLIVLAGWMHIFTPAFLDHFPRRVINLHPALPGTFPGINAIERALAAYHQGEIDNTGCMIHYVIPEVDAGAVIAQAVVPITPDDTIEDLNARMQATEHRLIVRAVRRLIAPGATEERP